ncbi:hypothetical protein BH23THE1_BH23THE1_09580 [soil metagenome]
MFFPKSFCINDKKLGDTNLIYIHDLLPSMLSFLQIVIAPEAFGVWIPLAVGLGIGLIYAIASMARRAR